MPKLSIITVNLNNLTGLQKTMQSVFEQTFTDYEYIMIDGGSTDGSKEEIKKNENKLVYWVSEKDKGIFNAMNKGLERASGEYLLFLNAGDLLFNAGVFEFVSPFLTNAGIVYGDLFVKGQGKEFIKKYNSLPDFLYFNYDTLPHQGSFIYKPLLDQVGGYDESLKICADWKFFLEAVCRYSCNLYYLDEVVTIYDYSGISSIASNKQFMLAEKKKILEKEWKYIGELTNQLKDFQHKYNLLANSRMVKTYKKLRSIIGLK